MNAQVAIPGNILPAPALDNLNNMVRDVNNMDANAAPRFLVWANNFNLRDLTRRLTAEYLGVLAAAFGVGVNAPVIDVFALNQQFRGLDIDHRRNLVSRALNMMPWGAIPLNYRDWLVVYAEVEIVGGGM